MGKLYFFFLHFFWKNEFWFFFLQNKALWSLYIPTDYCVLEEEEITLLAIAIRGKIQGREPRLLSNMKYREFPRGRRHKWRILERVVQELKEKVRILKREIVWELKEKGRKTNIKKVWNSCKTLFWKIRAKQHIDSIFRSIY